MRPVGRGRPLREPLLGFKALKDVLQVARADLHGREDVVRIEISLSVHIQGQVGRPGPHRHALVLLVLFVVGPVGVTLVIAHFVVILQTTGRRGL